MENRCFPVFIPTAGKKAVVFGGGKIAQRRVKTLAEFDFEIAVVSPEVTEDIKALAEEGRVRVIGDTYKETYLDGADLVTACTDDRAVNREIGEAAKARGLLVSVCDRKEECNFYFPAVALNEELTMGLCGSGKSHDITRRAAAKLREIIKGKAY